jgi:uracil-DNA glycosylase family 4
MGMSESEAYELLNLAEDYVLDGFRHDHPPLRRIARTSGAPAARSPAAHPGHPPPTARQALDRVAEEVASCTLCPLHRGRRLTVPGEGAPEPMVMVIGEGPGAEEDRTGRPFVGKAGQYLDRWLAAVGLDRRTNCFIGNIVKCRPPGNRDPLPGESAACLPYLERQLAALRPRAILALGRIAAQILAGSSEGIGRLRGRELEYGGLPVVATYHPSAVLRNTELRAAVWEDLKRLRGLPELKDRLGRPPDGSS